MISLDKLYVRDSSICHLCKRFVKRCDASRDHVIPRSRGGCNAASNIALAHKKCNNLKGNGFTFQDEIRIAGEMCDWTCPLCKCTIDDNWDSVAFMSKRTTLVHRKCRENERRKMYGRTKVSI